MATILLVEDTPDLGLFEARLLEAAGHSVVRCSGGPALYSVCPLMRGKSCGLADAADLIVFSCRLFTEMPGRMYRGIHLLRSYRAHPVYGRLPFLVVSLGDPGKLDGLGPLEVVEKYSDPKAVLEAIKRLLSGSEHAVAEVVFVEGGRGQAPGDVVLRAK